MKTLLIYLMRHTHTYIHKVNLYIGYIIFIVDSCLKLQRISPKRNSAVLMMALLEPNKNASYEKRDNCL